MMNTENGFKQGDLVENDMRYFIAQLGCDCDGSYPSSPIYAKDLTLDDANERADSSNDFSDGILYIVLPMSDIHKYS